MTAADDYEAHLDKPLDDLDQALVAMTSTRRMAVLEFCVTGRDRWATTSPSVAHFFAVLCDRILDAGLRLDRAEDRLERELMLGIRDLGKDDDDPDGGLARV